ncbi:glycosyltransferase family 9 protein [Selenomonas ruminantium]|uniref:glycosyltransferase family 9 protein n=1 Tax=Selenomonas ruminantium TaxID=971 RepID=UPI00047DA26D|nr:glycosyltransferase family 9 protein [Selenomonas ruminantium]
MMYVDETEDGLSNLINFANKYNKIYIYGAGAIGEMYYYICQNIGIQLNGFVVSVKSDMVEKRLKVFSINEITPFFNQNTGVIIGASTKYHNEILNRLKSYNVGKKIFSDVDVQIMFYKSLFFIKQIKPERHIEYNKKHKKIAFIRLDNLGDILMTLPLIRETKRTWQDARITVIVRPPMVDLFKYCPYVDTAIGYDPKSSMKEKKALVKQYLDTVDIIILPRAQGFVYGRGASDELLLMSMAVGCRKIGWTFGEAEMMGMNEKYSVVKKYLVPQFSDFYFISEGMHDVEYMLKILEEFGGTIQDKNLELWYGQKERRWVESELKKNNIDEHMRLVAVGLTGSTDAQNWPVDKYKELFDILYCQYNELRFVILGNDSRAMEYADALRELPGVIDFVERTNLLELAAVIDRCDFYLGSDTGLMHMSAALNKPVIEISFGLPDAPKFWDGSPSWTGAYGVSLIVCMAHYGIEGCKKVCHKPYHCIGTITVQEVKSAVDKMMFAYKKG